MPPTTVLLAAAFAVMIGGLVQSGVGLGLGIIASPVVTLLDPALMPGSLLVAGAALPALILAREARHTDWPGVSWALAGRLAGTAAGIWVVTVVPVRALGIVVGAAVLGVIALSSIGAALPRNRWTLLAAGIVSGTTGTSTSIGGAPGAPLLHPQHRPPGLRDPRPPRAHEPRHRPPRPAARGGGAGRGARRRRPPRGGGGA